MTEESWSAMLTGTQSVTGGRTESEYRTGIPGEGAKTKDVTIGFKDFNYQEAPHLHCLAIALRA